MRIAHVRLRDPSHRLPMPDRGGRLFSVEGERVDVELPFWRSCLADGSIEEVEVRATPAKPKPKKAPATSR